MAKAGTKSVGSIQAMDLGTLIQVFGSSAQRLYELALGIDHVPVVANRERKQVSAEDTLPEDISLAECEPQIRRLAEKVWAASQRNARQARTVVLKLKTKEFVSITRSHTPPYRIATLNQLTQIAASLCGRVDHEPQQLYRLAGVGLSNFTSITEQSERTGEETSAQSEVVIGPIQQVPLLITDEVGSIVE